MKPTSAFAAVNTSLKPPAICVWTIRGTAAQVRHTVGFAWIDSNPKQGWEAAKIEGMRVAKVNITVLR